jgi:hypothetical protein
MKEKPFQEKLFSLSLQLFNYLLLRIAPCYLRVCCAELPAQEAIATNSVSTFVPELRASLGISSLPKAKIKRF